MMNTPAERSTGEENLALRPGVKITVSVSKPTGGGARDVRVLLNEDIAKLDGQPLVNFVKGRENTYDTYDGQNLAIGPDWYAIQLPELLNFNCLEVTMGFAYRDGGWWTSLDIETQADVDSSWHPVKNLKITPSYNFSDMRAERRPFETYVLTFDSEMAQSVRIIGQPGGRAQFTSLARLAIYQRRLSFWNPANLQQPPMPYFFRLVSPAVVWDLSKNFAKLTNLVMCTPLMEHYLDQDRFLEYWQIMSHNYLGKPDLWFLAGETVGWRSWHGRDKQLDSPDMETHQDSGIHLWFNNTLAYVAAKVVVEDAIIATVLTEPGVILKDNFDEAWHRRFAQEHDIAWTNYVAAIERTPQMTESQLEGALGLIGMIANTIAGLAHRNLHFERELKFAQDDAYQPGQQKKQMIHRAIEFIEEKLEEPISVADVARAVALSPAHFCVVFTEQTGRNPSDYLIDLRIERAKEYLVKTGMSVMDICTALGYSPSYFSRIFKKRTGCTPGEYARQNRTH